MRACPLRLGPYLGGEGMYQKSENMWSFQMTPSNLRNVIFMCAKYFHGEMALQRNVLFLGLPVYNSVDYVWDHILEGKACIKNPKTCGPSPWPTLSNSMSYSCVGSISIEKRR